MTERPTLPEPIVVHRFFANRRKDVWEHTLKTWITPAGKALNLIDIRLFALDKHGVNVPTRRGIALDIRRLRDLHDGIAKAIKRAEALGLLDGADDDDPADVP